jgi:effector-binding domain-containing protein
MYKMNEYQIELKTLPEYRVLAARGTASDYRHVFEPINQLYSMVNHALQVNKLEFAQPCVVLWHGDYRSEEPFTLEVTEGFQPNLEHLPDGDVYLTILPNAEVASTVHRGSFERFGEAYAALTNWISQEGYVSNGATREVYIHIDQDEAKNISELQIPVRKS